MAAEKKSTDKKGLVRKFLEELDRGNRTAAYALLDDDFRFRAPSLGPEADREGFQELVRTIYDAFPDLKHTVEEELEEGDRVAVRMKASGMHDGEFMGIPPTRKRIQFEVTSIFRTKNARLLQETAAVDLLGLLRQLEAAPAPENVAVVRQAFDHFNRNELDKQVALAADDVEYENLAFGAKFKGKKEFRAYLQNWRTGFDNARAEIRRITSQGDVVVIEATGRGTHTGPLQGPGGEIPATGKKVEIPYVEVLEFRKGKIARGRLHLDAASFLSQLGLAQPTPVKEEAPAGRR